MVKCPICDTDEFIKQTSDSSTIDSRGYINFLTYTCKKCNGHINVIVRAKDKLKEEINSIEIRYIKAKDISKELCTLVNNLVN